MPYHTRKELKEKDVEYLIDQIACKFRGITNELNDERGVSTDYFREKANIVLQLCDSLDKEMRGEVLH